MSKSGLFFVISYIFSFDVLAQSRVHAVPDGNWDQKLPTIRQEGTVEREKPSIAEIPDVRWQSVKQQEPEEFHGWRRDNTEAAPVMLDTFNDAMLPDYLDVPQQAAVESDNLHLE